MNAGLSDRLYELHELLKSGKAGQAQALLRQTIIEVERSNDASRGPAPAQVKQLQDWLSRFLDAEHGVLLAQVLQGNEVSLAQLEHHLEQRLALLTVGIQAEPLLAAVMYMCELLGGRPQAAHLPQALDQLHQKLRQHLLADEQLRAAVSDLGRTLATSLNRFESLLREVGDDTSDLNQARQLLAAELPSEPQAAMTRLRQACDLLSSADAHLHRASEGLVQNLQQQMRELGKLRRRLKKAQTEARRDALTGLANRRQLMEYLQVLPKKPACLLLLDLDHFKHINDTYGHPLGDEVLMAIGARLKAHTRGEDLIARIGGEEFAAVLPGVGGKRAYGVAEELRQALANEPLATSSGKIAVTMSVGVAARRLSESIDNWLQRADQALYQAKNNGRNRTELSVA